MEFVVLVKVVPAVDALTFDPVRRVVDRSGVPLFLNPFDPRALRVALELRRPAETVTVVSLGPPATRTVLAETRAVGADRTVLVSDPAFAGSDTLATARVLAAALRRLPHDVVLTGAWSTDSETGQVGPELATLLGRPILSNVRALRRRDAGPEFDATVDTARGWARYRCAAPVVLTVGEKVAKPLKPTPAELAKFGPDAVEVWSRSDVGVDPATVGFEGSPTSVEAVTEVAPTRHPVVESDGPLADRVGRLVERLRTALGDPTGAHPVAPERATPPGPLLVLASDDDGRLDPTGLEVAAELGRRFPDATVRAVWAGRSPRAEDEERLRSAGVGAGIRIEAASAPPEARAAARALAGYVRGGGSVSAVLFPSHPYGREFAGAVAAELGLGLVGDATGWAWTPDRGFAWSKPSFGDRTEATIRCRTTPELATIRPGAFAPPLPGSAPRRPTVAWERVAAVEEGHRPERVDAATEWSGTDGPDGHDVVVTVGMGIESPEAIRALAPLLARWGAGLAATRRVVDAGWLPVPYQVGLTGRSGAPRLVVLLGVSGSTNHLIGWRRARTIVAVNRDPAAPVFRSADLGLVADVEAALPLLDAPVAQLLRR